jgi:hypothetical protein
MKKNYQTSTYSLEDSLAKPFQLLESGEDLKIQEAPYFLMLLKSLNKSNQKLFF